MASDNLRSLNSKKDKYRCECVYGGIGDMGGRFCGNEVKRRDEITSTYWTESHMLGPDEIWSCSKL